MPSEILPEVFVTNGQLFESQGNYTKALDNYSKALEKEPANEAALLSTASLYLRQGHLEQANEFFTKAISVNPRAETFNELALVQQKQGLHADAQASIGQAIARAPQSLLYRNNLANMLVSVGRSDEAVKQLEQVLAPAQANYNVACLHFSNNNLAAAQQHLQIALQADPNLVDARQLMDRIVSNPTTKTAIAAYQNAAEVYRAVGQSSAAGPVTTIR
ncbi:MAG: tetratricopeptide repeat protein [Planctomycetales bacterium]|nr:tetratricopeptide repeat protein [Planctomycetales bacterium]